MMHHIDDICKKYGLHYLENRTDVYGKNIAQIPIEQLFDLNFITTEGNNRHLRLMRAMESCIMKLRNRMSLEDIKTLMRAYNMLVHQPPKNDADFEQNWKDALKFVAQKDAEKAAMQSQEELLDGCVVMELINRSPETYAAVIKKDDYHNPTTKTIHPIRAIQEIEVIVNKLRLMKSRLGAFQITTAKVIRIPKSLNTSELSKCFQKAKKRKKRKIGKLGVSSR